MALSRKELVDALSDAFDAITFDRMLSDYLNIRREILVGATGLAGFDVIVSMVVEIADERRWVIDLIRAALAARPGSQKLNQFIAKYPAYDPAHQTAPQTYFLSVFMRSRRVFCKRDQFRQKLQRIGAPNESRVLAIDGDRKTGKTYSQDFLNYLLENEPGWAGKQQIIYIDMDDCVFEPEDLVRIIGQRVGLDPATMPPDKGEQAPRRIPALMEWIIPGLKNSATDIWWLILDGFRVKVHPAATHDLIRAIVDATERDQKKVRMILLNYKEYLDLDIVTFILTEEIEPIDEDKDLPDFFRHVYTLSKRPFSNDDIDQTIKKVRQQVNDEVLKRGSDWRMKLLSIGLTKAANELLK